MRIHAAEGLPEYVDGVVLKGVGPGESLEEHQTARYADRLVQPRREYAAPERKIVLFRSASQYIRFYYLQCRILIKF